MPRYTVDFGEKFDRLLSDLAKADETTKSEIIRRAVSSYAYLRQETQDGKDGKKVSITDASDHVLKDVVLP